METSDTTRVHAFGEFELDEGLYELRRGGRALPVEPRVFDVLRYLVRHRDRVVTKDEPLDRVWAGEHVTESVIHRAVNRARRLLGREGRAAIQTVHGRGYRFVAPVSTAWAASPAASGWGCWASWAPWFFQEAQGWPPAHFRSDGHRAGGPGPHGTPGGGTPERPPGTPPRGRRPAGGRAPAGRGQAHVESAAGLDVRIGAPPSAPAGAPGSPPRPA